VARDDFRVIGFEYGARRQAVEFELRGAGTSSRRFIRASEPILEASSEAFIACSLVPAMASGVGVELEGPASARLVSALPTLVEILTAWNTQLTRVSFPSLIPVAKQRSSPGRVGAFFSGGVDSLHTFLEHRDEVTDLIFVHGFDIPLENVDLLRQAAGSVEAVASEFGVGVVHVETNLKPFMNTFVNWGLTGHGVAIATIGHLLAPVFERLYIASSVHFSDLFPWGTHPLLDPLWNSEVLEFVHHGCGARRIEKVELLAGFDAALNNLRVCHWGLHSFEPEGAYNCGRCEKCVRTMVSLEAAGKLSQCKSFDRPLDSASVGELSTEPKILAFFLENLEALRKRGTRPDLQRALERCLRRPTWLNRTRGRARRALRRIRAGFGNPEGGRAPRT
jgi:hypothetical protein